MTVKDTIKLSLERIVDVSYDIVIGCNLFSKIIEDLKNNPNGTKYAIITDSIVEKLYANDFKKNLANAGIEAEIFPINAGENSKFLSTCEMKMEEMSELYYGKDSAIIALGGGVVGDVAGFIATIYNRGIPYIYIPTTFQSQIDSAIGGKPVLNLKTAKNQIGSYKQPEKAFIDINLLKTLPQKEYISGLAEVIKYGIIGSLDLFEFLEKNSENILKKKEKELYHMIQESCRIKGQIVEKDLLDEGERKLLNYGHTIGHAIVHLSNYKLSHGQAISIGMVAEAKISNILGYIMENEVGRIIKLFELYKLPTKIPDNISNNSIIETIKKDKKGIKEIPRFSLPKCIGQMKKFNDKYVTNIDEKIIRYALDETR